MPSVLDIPLQPVGHKPIMGVYLLFLKGVVIHISYGLDVMKDIFSHEAKSFDAYQVIPCEVSEMTEVALGLTSKYLPNVRSNDESYELRIQNIKDYLKENMIGPCLYFKHDYVGIMTENNIPIVTAIKQAQKGQEYRFKSFQGYFQMPGTNEADVNCGQIIIDNKYYIIKTTDIIQEYALVATNQFFKR